MNKYQQAFIDIKKNCKCNRPTPMHCNHCTEDCKLKNPMNILKELVDKETLLKPNYEKDEIGDKEIISYYEKN